ncbi:hypothetical protein DICPUDRAFT_149068 [Dictyostelium purpureum]|uniref:Carrier domain-containing protein n=1 Tax=Dictyostelium purpureum TaxID=5786 RepID=F0ZCR7_DICPU|nr:uncharacterized protein DICPUDRAFT_149068 [Dictyostelium purpureum]EGC38268.1 hypothetical protein DICPUDRAFT_149068 [Dictyostelium purpureum]|eukprot:XP_003285225.1 hypothetical protein DICPUDRAFT_149068 [Dictyostelium purpureum]
MDNDNKYNNSEDVAIIGVGFRLPGNSNTPDQFWENLKNKFNGIVDATKEYQRWGENHFYSGEIKSKNAGLVSIDEWKSFDPLLFSIAPNELGITDPQQRLLLKSTFEALEDAGLDPLQGMRGTNTSVYIGATTSDYKMSSYTEKDNSINSLNTNLHTMSNRISYCFDFRGQSLTLDTACSSSSNAIQLGYKSIINGDSEYSIVGGSNLILDTQYTKAVSYLNMTGAGGYCKSFDSVADGFVRAEGSGILVLKKLSNAIKDGNNIYCVIKGVNSNADGTFNKTTFFAPSKYAQHANLEKVLLDSKTNPSDIDYFECHGTGTPTGDPIETEAISMSLKDHRSNNSPLLIGSVKSNIGHLEPASGVASVIKCCLMFKHRQFAPNIHFNNPNPNIKFNEWNMKVVTDLTPFPKNKLVTIGVNNFGATGSNVCIILKEYNQQSQLQTSQKSKNEINYLIPFSANSKTSLEDYKSKILNNISNYSNKIEFDDFIKHQVFCKSPNFLQRSVISAKDWNSFNDNFKNQIKTSSNKSYNILHKHSNPEIIFVMCGQGPQYTSMSLKLYENNTIFRKSMDMINEKLSNHAGFNILEKLRSIDPTDKKSINDPLITQTSLFIVQFSLIELYKHWGIKPSIIVGHSFGELTSTYCSGMLDLDDVCYLVYQRARLQSLTVTNNQDKSLNSRMLVINISEEQFNQKYSSRYPDITICCYNSPSSIVVGGNETKLIEIFNESKSNGIFSAFLGVQTAFHSSAQESIKDLVYSLKQIKYNKPTIPTFSTVTGELFGDNEIEPPVSHYIYSNIREPVMFSKAIESIFNHIETQNKNNRAIFLEISPHPTLSYYIKQMIPKESSYFNEDSISVINSLNKTKYDTQEIQNTISQLYCKGYNVNFKSQFINEDIYLPSVISNTSILPRYQWDNNQYWSESDRSIKARTEGPSIDQKGFSINSHQTIYESFIDINRPPFEYLKGHVVKDKYYFPGCGYIDNLISIFNSKDFIIPYLEFKTPLILKEKEVKHLQTSITKTSRNEYKVSFSFKDNNEWVETSLGKIHVFNFETPIEKLNFEKLKLKCGNTKLSKDELYTHIKSKTGLSYLNHFKRVEECYQGDGCTFSKISLNPSITSFKKSFLDPSIIDTTLHGFLSYIEDPCQIVFDRVEDYKVYSTNIPSDISNHTHIYCYSEYLGKFGESLTSSLKIMLNDGTVIIEADKVVCTSLIPIRDPLQIQNPNNELFSMYWQERDSLVQKSTLNNLSFNNPDYDNNILTIIENSIIPIKNEKAIFRILQISNNYELSTDIINLINTTLSNNSEIDIEFSIGLESNQEIKDIKSQLPSFNGSLLLKEINLYQALIEKQQLKFNYYDIIILPKQLQTTSKLIKDTEIFNILNPKGYLIHNSSQSDEELNEIGFEFNNFINPITISQKPSVLSNNNSIPIYDNIFIFGESGSSESNKFINILQKSYNNNVLVISNIDEFNLHSSEITDNSLIYFITTINQIKNQNDIARVTLDYVNINQHLLKNKLSTKHIIVSTYCQKEALNYTCSAVIGARRYFEEFIDLRLFSIDFDNESLLSNNVIENIECLTSTYQHSEYLIRKNIPYFERIKKESNLKTKFKSTSYKENNGLLAKLDPNLQYKLAPKKVLNPDYVEVKTEAIGINFKDNLIYRGLVPAELINSKGDIGDPEFGFEFSGIITRIGDNVTEYKIGDQVFGLSTSAASTHIYLHKNNIFIKPNNISFVEASIIPIVYMTSLYCLFNIGNLNIEEKESVLIHTGTGGVGLSALNILKWKGFKSHLFVTVGSKEKEDYLREHYGSLITGIYSTRNINYVKEIKQKLKQLGSQKDGVDLILNTFSNEFMDANFKCLCKGGRIVDVSTTHLNPHEYTDFNKFKYNIGYHAVELLKLPNEIYKMLLKKLYDGFSTQGLELIPINVFSANNIKEAIEFMNERKLIGKISVKMDSDVLTPLLENYTQDYNFLKPDYKINHESLGKTVLVTGQTGLILEILKWISKCSTSVETIIILSKSKKRWEIEKLINGSKNNIKYIFKSCDIGEYESISQSIKEIYLENKDIGQVESIFHFAFQYVNHEPLEVGKNDLYASLSAKSFGAMNLHNLSLEKQWELKQFILASSVTAIFGSPIQVGYTSSNYFLDALARHRRSLGLPAISTFWGLFETAGFISKQRSIARFIENMGFTPITVNLLLGSLDLFIQNQEISNSLSINIFNDSIDSYANKPANSKIDFISNAIQSKNKQLSGEDSGATQKVIDKISELLTIEASKINHDCRLIDLGSDSMVIISLKNFIDSNYTQNLFTISQLQTLTINRIIQNISKSVNGNNDNHKNKKTNNVKPNNQKIISNNNNKEFWEKEIKLNNTVKNLANTSIDFNKLLANDLNVLLTGTSGYLGVYLLSNLLKRSNCSKIYCLVRNKKSNNEALETIINNLKYHRLYEQITENEFKKIEIVLGDISIQKFGLQDEQYNNIASNINLIINCGAYTNLISPYSECKPINVASTYEMLKFANHNEKLIKPIVHISSFSIFTNIQREEFEDSFIPSVDQIEQSENGYGQSKIVSEYLVREASNRGIPSIVLRLPFIFANPYTGIGNKNDFVQLFIQQCYKFKIYPDQFKNLTNLAPITWISDNVCKMILNTNCWENNSSKSYNLISDTFKISDVLEQLSKEYNIQKLDYIDWRSILIESKNESCNKILILDPHKSLFTPNLKATSSTIKLLESMNSKYNDSFVTISMIKKHIDFHFK